MLKVGATAGVVKLMVDNSAVILGDETATSECGGRSCIRLGAEGKLIQEINIRLAGFGGNVPTTNFTARTANMIRQFQRDYMEIQPTGRICGDTLKAIDEFGDNYTFVWDELKCTCGVCDGFGRGLDSDEKQDASIAERSRKYEYPGIHRSLLWGFKASMFYLTKKEGGIFSVNKISSGYRCQENNRQRGRSSTNHMGKAIDIHYNKNGTRTRSTPDIETVRSEIFNKCMGAKWDWRAEKNIFYLESTRVGATTWVHVDVREFELPYLKDEFFAKTEAVMNGQKIVDLANAEGYSETCACMGDYASQDGATTGGTDCFCFNDGLVTTPCSAGTLITDEHYQAASERLGVEVAMMQAIAKQESKRNSFWEAGQATILFERHKMWKYLKEDAGKTDAELAELKEQYPLIVNNNSGGYGLYSAQYEKLATAKEIHYTSAVKSCSWGKFQVMGFNYAVAFDSPEELEEAVNKCELQQFQLFLGYLENTTGLVQAMINKDWETIASKYNGANWRTHNPHYASNLEQYYNEFK